MVNALWAFSCSWAGIVKAALNRPVNEQGSRPGESQQEVAAIFNVEALVAVGGEVLQLNCTACPPERQVWERAQSAKSVHRRPEKTFVLVFILKS